MNLASRGVDPMGSEILFVNFNQDFTCLSVGSRHGYKIYNCEPFGKYFIKRIHPFSLWEARMAITVAHGAIAICEMLFQTSLVALVGIGDEHTMSPRKLQITNTKVHLIHLETREDRGRHVRCRLLESGEA